MIIKVIDFGGNYLPIRAHYNDAGADVFIPAKYGRTIIHCNETLKIPLGFGLELPDGYAGYIFPRSGWSAKGIVCGLPPIDSGYRGEVHAIVTNCSNKMHVLEPGQAIGQLVIMPIIIADFRTENDCERYPKRNANAFGSTGD